MHQLAEFTRSEEGEFPVTWAQIWEPKLKCVSLAETDARGDKLQQSGDVIFQPSQ